MQEFELDKENATPYNPNAAPVVTGPDAPLGQIGGGSRPQFELAGMTEAMKNARELRPGSFNQILPGSNIATRTGIGALGALTFSSSEFGDILKLVDNRIEVSTGPNGGVYVRHPDVGETFVINQPGISGNDVINVGAAILAATPAGAGRTVATRAAMEAAIQASIEGTQALAGGEFNPTEVAIGGAGSLLSDLPGIAQRGLAARRARRVANQEGASQFVPAQQALATASSQTPEQAAESLQSVIRPRPEIQDAVEELDLQAQTPARIVSGNEQYRQLEEAISKTPATAMAESEKEFLAALNSRTSKFIEDFGGTRNISEMDQVVKQQIQDDLLALRTKSNQIYNRISDAIPAATRINDVSTLRFALLRRARDLGGIANLSQQERRVLTELTKASRGRGITYGFLDELRREVGAKLGAAQRAGGVVAGLSDADFQLQRLYDGLTSLQDTALKDINPELSAQWNLGKSLVNQRKELEKIVTTVAGRNLEKDIIPQLATAMSGLSRGNVRKFKEIIASIPESLRQEAVVTAMGQVFTQGARTQVDLSSGSFAAWWTKTTRDAGTRKLLFENLPPGAPKFLRNLAAVSKSYADAKASVPATGIIRAMEQFNQDGGFIAKVLGMLPVPGANKLGQLLGAGLEQTDTVAAATELMADNRFRRILNRTFRGEPTDRAVEAFTKTKVYLNWLNTVPVSQRERILTVGLTNYFFGEE